MEIKCFNHPETMAVSKCTHCGKPICDACFFYKEGSVYCAPACAQAMKMLGQDLHRKLDRSRSGPGLIAGLFRLAIVVAIVLAALQFFNIFRITDYF